MYIKEYYNNSIYNFNVTIKNTLFIIISNLIKNIIILYSIN